MTFVIWWGTEPEYEPRGQVAYLCPFCHDVRAFQLVTIRALDRLLAIVSRSSSAVGYPIRCPTCGVFLAGLPSFPALPVRSPPLSPDELIAASTPYLRAAQPRRFALADQVRTAPAAIPAAERREIIDELLLSITPAAEARMAQWFDFNIRSAVRLSVTLTLTFALAMFGFAGGRLFDVVLFGGLLYTGARTMHDSWPVIEAQLLPLLARGLAPLRPTKTELAAAVARLQERHPMLAQRLDPHELHQATLKRIDATPVKLGLHPYR